MYDEVGVRHFFVKPRRERFSKFLADIIKTSVVMDILSHLDFRYFPSFPSPPSIPQ
jgi:hypothetical protein